MAKLYELNQAFQEIQSMIEDGQEDLQDTLESIDLAIEDKLENIGKVIRNLSAESEALRNEEKRLADKRKAIDTNIERLKAYSEDSMVITGKDKVQAGLFTFAMQNNPPQVHILDDNAIPKKYYVDQEPKLDKKALKEALKDDEVPGAFLRQGRSLRIK